MTTTVGKQTAKASNRFDEDLTSVYELDIPQPKSNAYAIQVISANNDDEKYMLNAFHQQYVAIEGRSAIAQLVDTRIGEIAINSSFVMARTMEDVELIESVTRLGRLGKRLQEFDNRLLDQTARHILETDAIAVRTMHEDMRRNVYKPIPVPETLRRKRKGLIPAAIEFLFGEE